VALDTLEKCKKKNPKLVAFLDECMVNPSTKGINLFGFLIKPVQRLCKYPLLLRELLNNTPPTHNDFEYLSKAFEKINEVVEYVNERKRLAENLQRILDIQNTLEQCEMDLVDPARRFINEGTVKILGFNKQTQGKIYLFNDMVLWAKSKTKTGDVLKFAGSISLSNLRMVDIADSIEFNAWELEDKVTGIKVSMSTATPEEKKAWLQDLRAILKEFQKREAQEREKEANKASSPISLRRTRIANGNEDFITRPASPPGFSTQNNSLSYSRGSQSPEYPIEDSPWCDRCRENPASINCIDCDLPFCNTCYGDVHSKGKYRLHNFTALSSNSPNDNNSYSPESSASPPNESQPFSYLPAQPSNNNGRFQPPLKSTNKQVSLPSMKLKEGYRPAPPIQRGIPGNPPPNNMVNRRPPPPSQRGFAYY